MARIAGRSSAETRQLMKRAATRLIYEHGFEGMNLRMLADATGIQAGSFYNYISTKQDLLFMLLSSSMQDLNEQLEVALAPATDPLDALKRFVRFHIEFVTSRKEDVFIGNSELRSLTPENKAAIIAMRRAYGQRLTDILEQGKKARLFKLQEPSITSYSLIAMMSGVCVWYQPSGRMTSGALVKHFTALVLSAVGAVGDATPTPAPRRSARPKSGGAAAA